MVDNYFARHVKYMIKDVDIRKHGLEIGASYLPVLPKKDGYDVKILDVMTENELRKQYKKDPYVKQHIDNIEKVDYVWHGEKYLDIISEKFDFIIASNVIEHQTDLLNFFEDLESVLCDEGIISLGVPDKRFSFDIFREVTSIRTVFDVHQLKLRGVHPLGVHVDFALHNAFYPGTGHSIPVDFYHDIKKIEFDKNFDGIRNIISEYDTKHFIDQHAWIFTPTSLLILVKELYALELTNLIPVAMYEIPDSMEFYLKLRRDVKQDRTINKEEHLKLLIKRQQEEYTILGFPHMLADKCKEYDRVFIYGAGTIAKYILDILSIFGIEVKGVIISDGVEKKGVHQHEYNLSEIRNDIHINDLIIIGTTYIYQEEIKKALSDSHIDNYITPYEIMKSKVDIL